MTDQAPSNESVAPTRFTWLLELRGYSTGNIGPLYFSPGWNGLDWRWITNDPHQAIHFARKADAERTMNLFVRLNVAILTEEKWEAVEHGFMGATPEPPDALQSVQAIAHLNDACAEFVRMQHDIASLLGVDADTDSIDLHGRIYGALSTRAAEPREGYFTFAQISYALNRSLYAKTGNLAIEGIIEDLWAALNNGGDHPMRAAQPPVEQVIQCPNCTMPMRVRASAPPPVSDRFYGVPRDRPIWICSVCNGWNHVQDTFCTNTHEGSHPTKEVR